jgi:tetratricopeptide (TPR) repeat protein
MARNQSGACVSAVAEPSFAGPLRRAMEAHRAGRFAEVEFYCRLVLAADKKQFDALHLLGIVEFQRGRFGEALALIRRALKVNPQSVHAHSNLALVLQQLDRHEEALKSLDKALAIEPDNLLALNNRGHLLWRLKRSEEALTSLDRALVLKPDYVDALCNRGNVLVDLLRLEEALAAYDKALAIVPNDAPTLNNRANVLWALDRRNEALQSYDRAAALDPYDLSSLKDRGSALLDADRGEEALLCFDRALALKPDDIYFLYKRGAALAKLERYDEALACFDQALETRPDYVDALDNRGNVLAALQRAAEAIASYDRALAINPETPETHWNRGLTLLRIGDYEQGWKEYEWRGKIPALNRNPRNFAQSQWSGEQPIAGKILLLHAEQGFGDTIQFLRYVPLVAAFGSKVILEVQPQLKGLVSRVEGASLVLGRGEPPSFDYHCPLLSLPLAFQTRLETVPAETPYLSVAPERIRAWSDRLPTTDNSLIALAWAGNPDYRGDKTRSIGLPPLLPLLSTSGVQFVGIQKDLRADDQGILRANPQLLHLGDQLTDFEDTAAIMSLCDLVISSDTAVVHLAGALGRPVWVLLEQTPDWRWLFDRADSPWYPSARLFRQPKPGGWANVVAQVAAALKAREFRRGS